jgi:hypothetical protein
VSFLGRLLAREEPEPPRFQPTDLGDQRRELPPEALTLAASGGALEVVGESHHRDAIAAATGGRRIEGIRTTMWATLVAEHDNPTTRTRSPSIWRDAWSATCRARRPRSGR